jgi:hypothetical protein
MNSKLWIKKALTSLLSVSILASYSMVAFAASPKSIGEISVSGKDVRVNNEAVQSGRTLFATGIIATSNASAATLNLANGGKIEIAPNTVVSADSAESFTLNSGKITSFSNQAVNVVVNGKSTKLNSGESASAAFGDDKRDANGNCVDTDGDGKMECDEASSGSAWWLWTLVFGGAAAGIVIAALSDNNRVALGGGTTVVSPVR